MEPTSCEPARGEITDATDATGVTLSWPAYKAGAGRLRLGAGAFLLVWLCGWTFGGIVSISGLVNGRGDPFLVVWLCAWAAGETAIIWQLWALFRSVRPEHVRLEADRLSYYPGRGPDLERSCAERPDGKVVPVTPAPATEVPKSAIRGFGIDRVNERQRLFLDADDRRIEIGGCLTESERAWLLGVLQMWLGKPVAPPWSRAAQRPKENAQS